MDKARIALAMETFCAGVELIRDSQMGRIGKLDAPIIKVCKAFDFSIHGEVYPSQALDPQAP
jgi:hypothetical protein